MSTQNKPDLLQTSKILWIALTMTPFMFGFALFSIPKELSFTLPPTYNMYEVIALVSNLMLFVTFSIHEKLIKPVRRMEQRLPKYIVCYALHESVVLFGFIAVFLSEPGHVLVYGINLIVATFGNVIMFPRSPEKA